MRWLLPTLLVLPCLSAAEEADPARGEALAERWCAECHVIAPGGPGSDVGPPFTAMPAIEEVGEGALRAWLFDPHDPMPDLDLAPAQISDIVAYMRTLEPAGEEAAQ